MERINFTKTNLNAIEAPEGGRLRVACSKMPYLIVRVTNMGTKTFCYRRRWKGKQLEITLGVWPDTPVDLAMKLAGDISGRLSMGLPAVEAAAEVVEVMTFGKLFDRYMELHAKLRKRSWKEDERKYRKHLMEWEDVEVEKIKKADVLATLAPLVDSPVSSNRLLSLIKKVFNFGIDTMELEMVNPARSILKYDEMARRRYLSRDEVTRFLGALDLLVDEWLDGRVEYLARTAQHDWEFWRDFFRVILFTGSRAGVVCMMDFDEIDWDNRTWIVPARKMKGKTAATIVLHGEVVSILKRRLELCGGGWVFPGRVKGKPVNHYRRAWTKVCEKAGILDATVHDLRRTMGTWQLQGGADMAVVRDSLSQKDIRVTQKAYAHVSNKHVEQSINRTVDRMIGGVALDD